MLKNIEGLRDIPVSQFMGLPKYRLTNKDVGIEIEMELFRSYDIFHIDSDEVVQLSKYWDYKMDYSLKHNGVEFISRPMFYHDVPDVLANLKTEFRRQTDDDLDSSIYPSVRAGVHVHVNMQNKTMLDVFKLLCVYYPLENLMQKHCGSSREGNLFCLRFSDAGGIQQSLQQYATGVNLITVLKSDSLRYSALNLNPLWKFGTVEFRTLRTPTNISDITDWVDVIQRVVTKSSEITSFVDIPYKISGVGATEWASEILGKEFVDKHQYPDLEKDIINNMRKMQIINHSFQRILA